MKFLAASQDKAVTDLLCFEFENQGYATFAAKSVSELEAIQAMERCDVIVSERKLLDGSFFEFYDKLRNTYGKNCPIAIMLVSQKQPNFDPEVAFAMGIYAVFYKPFHMKDLYEAVEDAVYSKRHGLLRRIDERAPIICRLEFKSPNETTFEHAFSNNISFGGFFAATAENIKEPGSEVDFIIRYSDKETYQGRGKVIWNKVEAKLHEQQGFGVQVLQEREQYVKFLIPITNEARTRQLETSTFQHENLNKLLEESLHDAKSKVAKSKTTFTFIPVKPDMHILCRYPKMHYALTELLAHMALPLRNTEGSTCSLEVVQKHMKASVQIKIQPGGTSLSTQEVMERLVNPILKSHKAHMTCHFSSQLSTYEMVLPISSVSQT